MIEVRAEGLGKSWGGRWLFRNLSLNLAPGQRLVITGPSGCGKSTLLRIVAGQLLSNEGSVTYTSQQGTVLDIDTLYRRLAWAGPALEPHPALTVNETLRLHFQLKHNLLGSAAQVLRVLDLEAQAGLPMGRLSSGQRQRLCVGLALFTESELLILDEPTTHLDSATAERLLELISTYSVGRSCLFASNLEREFALADQRLTLTSAEA
jgi:ABC-type multidrug transport system ATPase subunit